MNLDLKAIRRELHRIPELGFDLPLTSTFIAEKLKSWGYAPQAIAQSGWLVILPGTSEDIFMFRTDMDGLPIHELNAHDFVSTNANMHACGHDAHMSMMLGLAYALQGKTYKQTIVLLFQPAEESPGGAKVVLEELPFETSRVKGCFGFHVYPALEKHAIGTKPYGFMATNGEIDIKVLGVSAHAGTPHQGKDAILIASSLLTSLQSIISRETNPLESKVLHIGVLKAGEVRNSVADTALMQGTIRAFTQDGYFKMKDAILRMIHSFEIMHEVKIECEIRDGYPVVYNNPDLVSHCKEVFKDQLKEIDGVMLAEDFGFYTQVMPSVFMFLGLGEPSVSLHSPRFDLDEAVLDTGVKAYLRIIESFQ
jgi:amidohydrolase